MALAALAVLSACSHPGPRDASRVGPFFTPSNFSREPNLAGIRRVILLPVWTGSVAPAESGVELDAVIATALQNEKRFEVVTLSREECRRRFRVEAISSASALPHDLFTTLWRDFAPDAVVFVDLTVYRPFRPLTLGLRGKLAAIDGTRLMWTFDEVFSADNPAVANSARHHFLERDRSGVPADLTQAALQSPGRFATYAASAMFATLPSVNAQAPAGSASGNGR
jgi:hypothetical protein